MDKQQRRVMLADVLAKFRLAEGLSQADVAERLGKPQSFVSKYETAQRRLEFHDLEDIAAALNAPLDQVLEAYWSAVQ